MRANTKITLAVRSVGDSSAEIESWSGTFAECLPGLAKWLGNHEMKKRFDLVIARTDAEARSALRIRRDRNGDDESSMMGDDSMLSTVMELMAGDGDNES